MFSLLVEMFFVPSKQSNQMPCSLEINGYVSLFVKTSESPSSINLASVLRFCGCLHLCTFRSRCLQKKECNDYILSFMENANHISGFSVFLFSKVFHRQISRVDFPPFKLSI